MLWGHSGAEEKRTENTQWIQIGSRESENMQSENPQQPMQRDIGNAEDKRLSPSVRGTIYQRKAQIMHFTGKLSDQTATYTYRNSTQTEHLKLKHHFPPS